LFERVKIAGAGVGLGFQLRAAVSRKDWAGERDGQAVGKKAGVATVAVSPRMYCHQTVVQAFEEFVGAKGTVLVPGANVMKK